jgi:hypothetical protein
VAFLDRSRTVAPPSWSRWLIPPAALSVHLSIGQAYAWSVFKPPLEESLDLTGTQSALPFQLAIVMLGLSAAFGGKSGPDLYTTSLYIMIGLLVVGFVANELVRPVNAKYHERLEAHV